MKKDYITVSAEQALMSEATYVEKMWSSTWEKYVFNNAASAEASIPQKQEYKIMKPYLQQLPDTIRMLDGGCGAGEWIRFFTKQGAEAIGLDISAEMVAQLTKRFPHARFVAGDIRHTTFPDNFFDVYFSWGTFEHFEEGLTKCMQEAYRILKPRGYLFISIPFQNTRHIVRERRDLSVWDEQYDKARGYRERMRFYQWRLTEPELERELALHGFLVREIRPIHKWWGLRRMVKHELHLNPDTKLAKITQMLLWPFFSKRYVSHMLMGVGQKP